MHAAQSRRSDYSQASWRWGNIFTAQYIFSPAIFFSQFDCIVRNIRGHPRQSQVATIHHAWTRVTMTSHSGAHTQKDNFVFLFRTHHENICRAPDTLFRWCRNAQQNHFDLERGCVICVESFQRTLKGSVVEEDNQTTILRPKHFRTYWTF